MSERGNINTLNTQMHDSSLPWTGTTTLMKRGEVRKVWRYQRGNQKPYIEGQTRQWPTETILQDKQWSANITQTSKGRALRTPLNQGSNSGAMKV